MTQAELAQALAVTNSHMSLIESGKRQPTEGQITILADVLKMPPELLMLGVGRLPKDVRGAFEENAAEVVAAVRQRSEALAVRQPIAPATIRIPGEPMRASSSEMIPERVDVTKASSSYRAHSYHTKVPPEAIRPFIRAFTRPGETVLDPFCGSGMTGVAALMEGRNAMLSDLSPAAVHIAGNYTRPCNPEDLVAALGEVERRIAPTIAWLYCPIGTDQTVEYTTWSDVYRCPSNGGRLLYWDVVQTAGSPDGDRITCTACGRLHRKADLTWVGEQAVQSHTSAGSNRIHTHSPTREELALIDEATRTPIPYWTPNVPFGPEREMWRGGHRSMGITDVVGFYTRRNLHALAALRHSIITSSEGRVRDALMFAFTAAVNRASKRYQWNVKRPTNVMTGTLYVSSLRYEWNVWSLFKRKAADVLRYYRSFPASEANVEVFQRSATNLDCIPDGSIDMIFMDPPFGSNIFYADASILWDAWLGYLTDVGSEIVINKSRSSSEGGKKLVEYGDLIQRSFAECARVLKPSGRAVLAFSNSDDQVWSAVQTALASAGFKTSSVHVLNKGQPSIKGVKGITGRESVTTFDLLICLEHQPALAFVPKKISAPIDFVDQLIKDKLHESEEKRARRTDEIYSDVIRAVIESNHSVSGITMPFIAARCAALGGKEVDGKWALAVESVQHDFLSGYLASRDSLPKGTGSKATTKPLEKIQIVGGRNSALYTAHSYHTKVPPEAIRPFIEHFSKPNDVVLDPFCGSGMTGVAASLAGRRAILNDLSPAAVHLAWNHTRPCDPEELVAGFSSLEARLPERFHELYRSTDPTGKPATIQWTMWSTRHQCPLCNHKFLLWDVMDRESGRLGQSIQCPHCKKAVRRAHLALLGSQPAWIAGNDEKGKRFEKAASDADLRHARSFSRTDITSWYPTNPLGTDREMFIRCALQRQGIASVADFYTPRNLEALSLLWAAINTEQNERVKRALAFAFTNTAWHGTRMRRFNARGGQRPLTGTLYIPQLSSEANVLEVMRHKILQLQRYFVSYQTHRSQDPAVLLGSATALKGVADGSVDYVFTDPPFGSNIFYADCNLIWESWLGRTTDMAMEAVVNRSLPINKGGKSLANYSDLMGGSMREIARVLKPGGWATVVFHNTDADVWKAIRDAANDAGFVFHEAASLDRLQQSHKGYKGRSGKEDVAHFDVVFNLQKPAGKPARKSKAENKPSDLDEVIRNILRTNPSISKRGVQGVHAEVMRQLASHGRSVFPDYAHIRSLWERITSEEALID